MDNDFNLDARQFKGLRNDEDPKNIPFDYWYRVTNFNYPDTGVLGIEKILMPKQIIQLPNQAQVDGAVQYTFLDSNSVLQTQYIAVGGGNIYRLPDLAGTTPILLKSGLQTGTCDFQVWTASTTGNDQLLISNGKNYIQIYDGVKGVVTEMGAPFAEANTVVAAPIGTYTYKVSFVTAGGEEVLGSISNSITVSNKQIVLTLPIGYDGVTSRKIYRTTGVNSNYWYLVATIGDNTTLSYTDGVADSVIINNSQIPSINNELPKPYHIRVAAQKLFGAKVDKFPTQIFPTETNVLLFDAASGLDVANYGSDNTPVEGIGIDFNKVLIGTGKNIILIEPSSLAVTFTRSNIGILDGNSIQTIPAFGDFMGGCFFVSTERDVRLMSGQQSVTVTTTVDNVRTENWAQNIRGTLNDDLRSYSTLISAFYNYKYHLCIDGQKYVFDIRTQGWTYHQITTETYQSRPTYLAIINGFLYNGQPDGWIEQEYAEITYRGEEVPALLESPQMMVNENWNMIEKMYFWMIGTVSNKITIKIVTNDDDNFPIITEFNVKGGAFDPMFYDSNFFDTSNNFQDFRVINIYRNARWIKYVLNIDTGNIGIQGFAIKAQLQENKERPIRQVTE